MSKEIEEEVEEGSFEEFEEDFDPELEGDIEEDLDLDDLDESVDLDEDESSRRSDAYIESSYADAVRANPKRAKAQARRRAAKIVEGIISDAELTNEAGQTKAWHKLKDRTEINVAKPYATTTEITENDVVDHPRFGIGFVIQLLTPTKVEVLFESGIKRLVCNVRE